MKMKTITIASNFHVGPYTRKIRIPADMTLDDYLVGLSAQAYCNGDRAAARRLRSIETSFCGKESGCTCGVEDVD